MRGPIWRGAGSRGKWRRYSAWVSRMLRAGLGAAFHGSGIAPEQMESSGLVRRRQEGSGLYDFFRGRLMFPIQDESGKVIAFGGRAMRDEDQPKYLNSSETPIYRKTSVLYNLHRARDGMRSQNRAVLVEGYMDVIGAYAAGVKEVVASLWHRADIQSGAQHPPAFRQTSSSISIRIRPVPMRPRRRCNCCWTKIFTCASSPWTAASIPTNT